MTNLIQKVLLVEDKDEHANAFRFPSNVEMTRVKTFMDAMVELYGFTKDNSDKTTEYSGDIDFNSVDNPKNPNKYNAVLTDLNFPLGKNMLIERLASKEWIIPSPLGFQLALISAQIGIPKIGIYTDSNHHEGAIPTIFDYFKTGIVQGKIKLSDSFFIAWDIRTSEYLGLAKFDPKRGDKIPKNYTLMLEYLNSLK
jgi:hypothetical protein